MNTNGRTRVIGIDPGYGRCGFAVLERDGAAERLVHSECFSTPATDSFGDRLAAVARRYQHLLAEHRPSVCAMEKLYFTSNHKTAMHVAEVRGALLFLTHQAGLDVHEYGPNEIKVAVTGDGRAGKREVTLMVHRLLGIDTSLGHDDEYDAIAVALTARAPTASAA